MPQAQRGRKKKAEEEMAEEDLEEQIEEVTGSELNISISEDSISIDLPRDGNERETIKALGDLVDKLGD